LRLWLRFFRRLAAGRDGEQRHHAQQRKESDDRDTP